MQNTNWQSYKEEGFLVLKDLIPLDLVRATLTDISELYSRQLAELKLEIQQGAPEKILHQNMQTLFNADQPRYLETARAANRLWSVDRLLTHENIIKKLSEIGYRQPTMPVSPFVLIMSNSLKIGDGYHGLKPHQDWTSTQGSFDTVTVWLPLVDVTDDLFPVEIAPKSHLRGIWPGSRNGLYYEVDATSYSDSDFVSVPVNQGDAIFMTGFTLHRTGMRDSKGLRVGISIRYDNSADKDFSRRAYPTTYSRSLRQDFVQEKLPTAEDVKKIFK